MSPVGLHPMVKEAKDRDVVRFGCTAGEDDFLIPGTNKFGNLEPRLLYGTLCLLTIGIDA